MPQPASPTLSRCRCSRSASRIEMRYVKITRATDAFCFFRHVCFAFRFVSRSFASPVIHFSFFFFGCCFVSDSCHLFYSHSFDLLQFAVVVVLYFFCSLGPFFLCGWIRVHFSSIIIWLISVCTRDFHASNENDILIACHCTQIWWTWMSFMPNAPSTKRKIRCHRSWIVEMARNLR